MMESRASRRRRISGAILHAFAFGSGAVVCLELALIIGYIFVRGIPGITVELLTTQPSYIHDTIGVLPNILNTLYIVLVAMAVVIPLGVCAAVYLSEYATNRPLVRLISFAVETLTGIPSVVFGLVGMLFFIQMMGFSAGVLSGGLTLAVMVLPTIISNTLESLRTVPDAYREGALALGSGRWHMVRTVVLPNALDGIATGCILAVGRIVGESAALLYTAGFGLVLNGFMTALQSSSATLTVALYIYATERGELTVAFSVATILMVITMLLNLATNTVSSKLGEKEKEHE
jgi:phosphate transport system permease protein